MLKLLAPWCDLFVHLSFTFAIAVICYLFVKDLRDRVKLELRVYKLELDMLRLALAYMRQEPLNVELIQSLIGEVAKHSPKPTIH